MAGEGFDDLLARMPEIADAVSKFPEAVQQQAFDALMAAAHGRPAVREEDSDSTENEKKTKPAARRPARRKVTSEGVGDEKARPRRRSAPTVDRQLDLSPKGKQSFNDFVAEKQPKNQDDKNAVIVYYLSEIAGVSPINLDHVFTCYRTAGWKVPGDLSNSVSQTASKKLFIDSADKSAITLMTQGLNRIEHDLPPKGEK